MTVDTPCASVVEGLPAMVAEAPARGLAQVTVTPGTALPVASATTAMSGEEKAVLDEVCWPLPLTT